MKTRPPVYLILLITAVLFISVGCAQDSGRRDIDFRTGSQAMELRFLQPGPEDFFEGDTLTVLVEYFNRGTADIVNGEFFVSGYDLQYMRLSLDPKLINIEGKNEFDPRGDHSRILTIRSTPLRMPQNTETFPQTVKLTACYQYSTLTTAEICVDPDPLGRRVTRSVCTMSPVNPGARGAPVVITRVEPIVSRNDFRLVIEFANQGNGIVYDRTISNEKCFADLDRYQDMNIVDVTRVDFSGRSLSCEPRNPVRMVDGRGRIVCECTNCIHEYMDAYKTQVSIEFNYGYRNEAIKQIRVLR